MLFQAAESPRCKHVIKSFRKMNIDKLDISGGVEGTMTDDDDKPIVFDLEALRHGLAPYNHDLVVGEGITNFSIERMHGVLDKNTKYPGVPGRPRHLCHEWIS